MIPVNRPLLTSEDVSAVQLSLSETLISGESAPVSNMEKELSQIVGVKHSIGLSSGTSAIDLLVNMLGIDSGDKCIVPTFTIVSSVAELLRKKTLIQLVDADPVTWSMNAEDASNRIGRKTKLVVPVHIYGLPVDMDLILEAAKSNRVTVVEDAAEALGVNYKDRKCGQLGLASIFSFYANKIVTGGEGGAIVTDDDELAERLRKFRSLAHESTRFVHTSLGWNYRISGLSASLIYSQLKRIEELKRRKIEIATTYLEGLKGHPWLSFAPTETSYSKNLFWVFPIMLVKEAPLNAEEMQLKLLNAGIETRRFFCPIHLQPFVNKYNFEKFSPKDFPVANSLWERGLYLPSGLGNSKAEIAKVIETLWSFL